MVKISHLESHMNVKYGIYEAHLVHDRHLNNFLPLGHPINIVVEETAVGVEVNVFELT